MISNNAEYDQQSTKLVHYILQRAEQAIERCDGDVINATAHMIDMLDNEINNKDVAVTTIVTLAMAMISQINFHDKIGKENML